MSVITVVGSGVMGSALSVPARDNGHEVRLVGTHLDREIIDTVKAEGYHPTLKRALPQGVKAFQLEEIGEALRGTDLVICGVNSWGVEWFGERILPLIPDHVPVLAVTKGLREMADGGLEPFPHYWQRLVDSRLSINAIGGPCTSYELADRRHSWVHFVGEDPAVLRSLKQLLETDYYHISTSTDVIGVEAAVAIKNAYALGVAFAVGLQEREFGIGCTPAYNPQAALFGQAAVEITRFVKLLGGRGGKHQCRAWGSLRYYLWRAQQKVGNSARAGPFHGAGSGRTQGLNLRGYHDHHQGCQRPAQAGKQGPCQHGRLSSSAAHG